MRKYGYVVLAILVLAPAAFAASAISTNTDNVTASVANNCKINTFALSFGPYDGVVANAAADLDTFNAVSVFCTKGTAPTSITMGAGTNASGSTRRMTNGTDFLTYEIFLNATRTTIWNASNVVVPNASTSKNTALDRKSTRLNSSH